MTDSRALLRHAVATLAYRGGKAKRDSPDTLADFVVENPLAKPHRFSLTSELAGLGPQQGAVGLISAHLAGRRFLIK